MSFLREMKKSSITGTVVFLVFVVVLFALPGVLALIVGGQGIIWGMLFLIVASVITIPLIRSMCKQKSVDAFLNEVDLIGNRNSVLESIDTLGSQVGFRGLDVRFHPYFIAYRTGNIAHIWKTADVSWIYIQQKNITNKTEALGVTVGKYKSMEFNIMVHCKGERTFSLPVDNAEKGEGLLRLLSNYCPSARIGYQE